MKRIMFGITTIICLGILTGCSNKKLECTTTGTDIGKKVITNTEVSFKSGKVSRVKRKIEMNFEEIYTESLEAIFVPLKEEYDKLNEQEGMKVNLVKGDNTITIDLDMDVKKYAKNGNEDDVVDISLSRDDMKKSLESDGYTCK